MENLLKMYGFNLLYYIRTKVALKNAILTWQIRLKPHTHYFRTNYLEVSTKCSTFALDS